MRRNWSAPGVDMERESRVALQDGEVVGFASIEVEDDHAWLALHGDGARRAHRLGGLRLARPSLLRRVGAQRGRARGVARPGVLARPALVPDGDRRRRGGCGAALAGRHRRARLRARRTRKPCTRRTWSRSRTRGSTRASPTRSGRTGASGAPVSVPSTGASRSTGMSSRGSRCAAQSPQAPETGWVSILGVRRPVAAARARQGAPPRVVPCARRRGVQPRRARRRRVQPDGGATSLRERRHARALDLRLLRARPVSRLRARCPDCRTLTAVALGPEYQCHSCGREFGAGLVRVPRAWGRRRRGDGRGRVARAAVPGDGRGRGGDAGGAIRRARRRPPRPPPRPRRLLLLARRGGRGPLGPRGDARGDLDRRPRRPQHAGVVALGQRLGDAAAHAGRRRRGGAGARRAARCPQPRSTGGGVHREQRYPDGRRTRWSVRSTAPTPPTSRSTATRSSRASSRSSCPSRTGIRLDELEELLRDVSGRTRVAGAGLTGLVADEANEPKLAALVRALGL